MNNSTKQLLREKIDDARMLEPIKISDTVHSWLNMLNRVVDLCNIVAYPEPDRAVATYANVFGFMEAADKLYLDEVKWGILPADDEQAVDIDARKVFSFNAIKKAAYSTVDASLANNNGTITVDKKAIDVQCIDARSDILLKLIANPDSSWCAEKLVSIKALEDVHIEYTGNNFSFVNNSIYPNVEWSSIGTPKKTLLLAGTMIVYRATFIHSRILLEVVENTQLLDNYKATSAKHADPSFNGAVVFDANSSTLASLSEMANIGENGRILYVNRDGIVGDVMETERCKATFKLSTTDSPDAKWESVVLECRPMGTNGLLVGSAAELQNGRHIVQLWTNDRTMVVKVDYALNMAAKSISILGFTVVEMNAGRIYDE